MNVLLIRPGETEFDRSERVQGTLNLPLTDLGRSQLRDLAEQLISSPRLWHGVPEIYCAPTEPAPESAKILAKALSLKVRVLEDLVNLHHGLWQGKFVQEIESRQSRVFRQWEEAPESVRPPEGETCGEVIARARKALRKALKRGVDFILVAPDPLAALVACDLANVPLRVPSLSRRIASGTENDEDAERVTTVATMELVRIPIVQRPGPPLPVANELLINTPRFLTLR